MKRCFVSIELPIGIIKEITKIQKTIEANELFRGKFTGPKNLHLTLKFLGEIEDELVDKVKERLEKIEFESFEAKIDGIGVFNEKQIRIIWLKMDNEKVLELQNKIDEALEGLFEKEAKFMGHITIARVKETKDKKKLLKLIKELNIKEMKFQVEEFMLKESVLKHEGPRYHILEEYTGNK